ncbi:hypothetical protein QBC34DRAFT_383812 [Podospora aff. communis PSN243]|uniref:Uncharacterized protein n=1 Tax=Podospora aff. communis PSN243 TaxID=3040156 RepID=A0AAV9GFX4_9PEZI|nr:hypothetical protein QBC34DRAFT_383812 [Podospora aff. communis PSN243]
MRFWGLVAVTGYGLWHGAFVEALAPQPGDGSGRVRAATSTVAHGTNGPAFGFAPLPTPMMNNNIDLRKRQDEDGWGDICGYVSGDARSPFGCAASSTCRTDTRVSVIHCCPATPAAGVTCVAMTACLDRTAFNSLTATRVTSLTPIPFETGWCTVSLYTSCVQYVYGSVPVSGFSWLQCGAQATREVALLSATTGGTETTTTSTPSPPPPPGSPATATPTPTPVPAPGNSTPVGAIVGGVIGGLAVIGLIILGLFYINRRSKNKPEPDPPAPQQPEVGYAPGPESPPLGYGPPADFRGSMFKAPYETNSVSVGSPPTSPTFPGDGSGIAQYHTPPPVEQYQNQNQNPQVEQYQPQPQAPVQVQRAQQQQYQAPLPPQVQPGGHVAPGPGAPQQQPPVYPDQRYELSIERGDGEMRELPGRG